MSFLPRSPVQPYSLLPPSSLEALNALAKGEWANHPTRPAVGLMGQRSLFPLSVRERFDVHYPLGIAYWPMDYRFALDFVTDDPINVPFLSHLGFTWCTPCHALISQEERIVAVITGILTFDSWFEEGQHSEVLSLLDVDEGSRLAVLSSMPKMELADSQRALEYAIELVYGIVCDDGRELYEELKCLDD